MPATKPSFPRRKPPRIRPAINANASSSSSAPAVSAAILPPKPKVKAEELPAYEFLGYLPESYGTMKLYLVARDPQTLFAYWDLSRSQYQSAVHAAHDGKVFLEVYVPGEGRVQQIHIWDCHQHWYLQVNRPGAAFIAQLGYYRADGGLEVLTRSAEVCMPRDTLSPNTDARFVTIPYQVSFRELCELIAIQGQPGEELAETRARLQRSDYELPFQARVPRDLKHEEAHELLEHLGDEDVRSRMVGSFEITEMLKKRFETMVSSGQWASSAGGWVTSVSSPFGASFKRERSFHMHVNAELIIYGGTEPNAKVCIDGQKINPSEDGNFRYHFAFPDGRFHIPVNATSADGVEARSAAISFARMTELEGDVLKTGQPVLDEPIGRQAP